MLSPVRGGGEEYPQELRGLTPTLEDEESVEANIAPDQASEQPQTSSLGMFYDSLRFHFRTRVVYKGRRMGEVVINLDGDTRVDTLVNAVSRGLAYARH